MFNGKSTYYYYYFFIFYDKIGYFTIEAVGYSMSESIIAHPMRKFVRRTISKPCFSLENYKYAHRLVHSFENTLSFTDCSGISNIYLKAFVESVLISSIEYYGTATIFEDPCYVMKISSMSEIVKSKVNYL